MEISCLAIVSFIVVLGRVRQTNGQQATDEHEVIGVAVTSEAPGEIGTSDHWFPQAGLGMFIPLGAGSIPAISICPGP